MNYGIFSIFTSNRLANLDDAFRRRCVSVFSGAVKSKESRIKLYHKFLDDTIDVRKNRSEEFEITGTTMAWIPGDYARFKRDVTKPMQLNEYLRQQNITMDDFYPNYANKAVTDTSSIRHILVELPLLTYSTIK